MNNGNPSVCHVGAMSATGTVWSNILISKLRPSFLVRLLRSSLRVLVVTPAPARFRPYWESGSKLRIHVIIEPIHSRLAAGCSAEKRR